MEALAGQLLSSADALRANPTTKQDHVEIIQSAYSLLVELKEPMDNVMDQMISLSKFVAMRLFIKWRLFDKIPANGAISYEKLAGCVQAEPGLIARFGSALVANGVLREVEKGAVAHTVQSEALLSGNPINALICLSFDAHLRTVARLPDYFGKFGLGQPLGRENTPITFTVGNASLTIWEHMNRSPEMKKTFMLAMQAMSTGHGIIGDYSFKWVVDKIDESQDRPLVVDVGGGKGHALEAIVAATGLPMERCVLEDLEPVLELVRSQAEGPIKNAQLIGLDFHTEQPVKGAVVYYIRRCLHDYGDADCIKILKQISAAMAPDSRILIVESVLGDQPSPVSVANDILMMMLGGKERTLEEFESIMVEADLVIEKLWWSKGTDYAIIEGRKAAGSSTE
ncbi:O-methyltransferase [Metarhizium album ARSEF 1941]|uniref:O-methyltransferase n=1 Tax=Metarhizium album (strain ARSEF 1941) TaxID=1081103 RepID=A0A0B2WWQ4_METAS|nr:O-methyltransferase [Metarhizium album ARSEF 1941]KHO00652.1 O-methyltransferase [Metarhizium album ARSEF 1941]